MYVSQTPPSPPSPRPVAIVALVAAGGVAALGLARVSPWLAAVALAAVAGLLGWLLLRRERSWDAVLAANERRYRALAEHSAVGIWHLTPEGETIYANPAMQRLLEVDDPGQLAGRGNHLFVTPGTLEAMGRGPGRNEPAAASAYEAQLVGLQGRRRTVLISGAPIVDPRGRLESLIGTFIDITDRKSAERLLEHRALHDPLTDLPNRSLFLNRLEKALARARRLETSTAVLFLDLDRFKVVNDSLGHPAGDNLLVALGQRLAACVREADTVARLGGDEFAVLLEDMTSPQQAVEAAERIAERVREPFEIAGHPVRITVSIGIALFRAHWEGAQDLLRYADVAMYAAKRQGGGGYHVFDPIADSRETVLLQIESDLWRAVANGEIHLLFQPIVGLASGRIAGLEALARWRHPEQGMLPPGDFIPLAEEIGAIIPIGGWVVREACRRQAEWAARWPADPPRWMSVNLSERQFRQAQFPQEIVEALADHGVAAGSLRFEITEGLLMDLPAAIARLRRLGARIAVDDFGTGYSSLGRLHRTTVDSVKIDRSFVSAVGRSAEDTALVTAVVHLARDLGLEVVAEGIESAEQLALLRRLGCDYGQGHYFARPLPAEEVEGLLGADPRW